ncbi:MAG: hypothetical protein JWR84_3906 [Caulobacter sp.]|nr:hypothetical protein [Caulobacter sp.]
MGLAALVALVVFAGAYAISHRATLPDPRSCIGQVIENLRKNGLGAKVDRRSCRRLAGTFGR